MNYEELKDIAFNDSVEIIEDYKFESNRIKGLYCDGVVALNNELTTEAEKSCILAEELGHHYTSTDNIIDIHSITNRKQEQKARMWAYKKMIPVESIIEAFRNGCRTVFDMTAYLNVTEDFFKSAIEKYKQKYGAQWIYVDCYSIHFAPTMDIMVLF